MKGYVPPPSKNAELGSKRAVNIDKLSSTLCARNLRPFAMSFFSGRFHVLMSDAVELIFNSEKQFKFQI
jgi:hypothetical protein